MRLAVGGEQMIACSYQKLHSLVVRQIMVSHLEEEDRPVKGAAFQASGVVWADHIKLSEAGKLAW
jgi:hypothetical protein